MKLLMVFIYHSCSSFSSFISSLNYLFSSKKKEEAGFSEKMEHKEKQNLHSLTQLVDTGFLEKFTKIVVSVSVFSLLFSHSSPLLSFLHSFNFYFSTFPYQLVTHTVDKNCIFLLCNGLVVFLAKYSGLIRFLSRSNRPDHHESFKSIIDVNSSLESSVPETSKEMMSLDYKEIAEQSINVVEQQGSDQSEYCLIKHHEQERPTTASMVVSNIEGDEREPGRSSTVSNGQEQEEEEEETVIYVEEDEEEDYKWSKGGFDLVGQTEEEEEEEEEEEGNGMLSTEELNKKFDEFIRKMKEEIRIEAQRQLIMV